jgi:hypothetical protein
MACHLRIFAVQQKYEEQARRRQACRRKGLGASPPLIAPDAANHAKA